MGDQSAGPPWADKLGAMQERLSSSLMQGSQFLAAQAFNIGQNTFDFIVNLFIVLYLLFFLLRDGDDLAKRIKDAIPLRAEQQRDLFSKFITVIRATVKGNIIVAVVQGALGGLILWFLGVHSPVLWTVLMPSLAAARGRSRDWYGTAPLFSVTGVTWQGIVMTRSACSSSVSRQYLVQSWSVRHKDARLRCADRT